MPDEPHTPAAADASDPSMEEILASIRRILNDDDAPAAPVDGPATPATPDDDVLVLDQSMVVAAVEHVDEPAHDAPHAAAPASEPPKPEMEAITSTSQSDTLQQPAPTPELLAPEAAAAAASSVGNLVRTLAAGRSMQVFSGGPTLEDMVRAELRPLLKEWLDTNLPPMVERLVRLEIERVVGHAVP